MAKILVVDDHASNRDLIVVLARHAGHETLEAGDGVQALALTKAALPQLVVCDILMPAMDGYEFVRQLRADPVIAHTKVMFYTANYHASEARALAADLGVINILVKPCLPEDVLKAIEQALGQAPTSLKSIDHDAVGVEHRRLLTQKLADKVAELERANQRLAVLTEMNLQLSSVYDAQALLASVCSGARELIGARYAVACVQAKQNGNEVQFYGDGLSRDETRRLVCPELQSGIFGEVMAGRKSRRFLNPGGRAEDIGFPTGYPSVHAGLVAPVVSQSNVYGWVCLLDKVGGEAFSDEDEWLSSAHAAQVGRIYENSTLCNQLRHRAMELDVEVQTRQQAEEKLFRTARARRVMAECNRVLVRATEERPLLTDMCRTIVIEAGDYGLAWIGIAHHDEDKTVETVACEGDSNSYFSRTHVSWGDNEYGQGPISRSVRLGIPQTERYVVASANSPYWQKAMLQNGYHAAAALPLIWGGETLGALCLASADQTAFDSAELELLTELADDIAYGMHSIRTRARQQQAEIVLTKSESRFEATFEQSAVGMAHLGIDGRFLRVNDKMCALLGYERRLLLEMNLVDVAHRDCVAAVGEALKLLRLGQTSSNASEQRYSCRNGPFFWGATTMTVVRPVLGDLEYITLVLQDITDRKRYEAELEHQASHDALTGLANRFLLTDRMERAVLFAQRSGRGVGVILIDLDRFKLINDGIGHDSGDILLREVARRLSECVRSSDTVARLGGDEFLVIMTEVMAEDDVVSMAQTLLQAVAQPMTLSGQVVVVTASLGVTVYPRDDELAANLFKNADVAMYRAKESGGNGFQFYAPHMNARILDRLKLEGDLRQALKDSQFELYYQPKVDQKDGRLVGAEALIRWRHPVNGLVSPSQFIPLAEDNGMIVPIGTWVIETACAHLRQWRDAGLPEVPVAVNVSARQFQSDDLVSVVSQALQNTGLQAESLVLEVTESAIMSDPEKARETLMRLRSVGVRISLDDFGTGYSSLSYLKRFPIDSMKIDQSFVRDIPGNSEDAAIAVLVISLAHSLELSVIAEGVETEAQLDFLRQQGCDEMQGYFFSRPLNQTEFIDLLNQGCCLPWRPAATAVAKATR